MSLILDGTTGIGIDSGTQPLDPASLNAVIQALIPTGTKMLFQQTAAPTGWTKDTTHDNKALRVVSGTASTGGTVDFTTVFSTSRDTSTVTATGTVGNTTLTTAQIPNHDHVVRGDARSDTVGFGFAGNGSASLANLNVNTDYINSPSYTGILYGSGTGGGDSHNHSFTGTGHFHATNLNVQYVDLIIATKD